MTHIEAMKEARSVIGTINTGKPHTLTIGGETVYWQREEWVRWALDEVLPLIDQAIAEAEKQEPYGYVWTSLKDGMETRFSRMYPANFYSPMDVISVYTHQQPKREPLTDEIPKGVLLAISNAGLTLLKTQHGYELRKLGSIEAKLKAKNTII